MAATLADSWTLANDAAFKQRVAMAAARVATAVKKEARAQPGAERVEVKRQALADTILRDPINASAFIAVALAAAPTVLSTITDAQLETAITQNWSLLAGVTPTEA